MKTSLFALVLFAILSGFSSLSGQSLPTPKDAAGDWIVREVFPKSQSRMPVQRMGNPSDQMPGPAVKSFSYDPKTGETKLYYDSKTKIGYDLEHGLMTDVSSGRVYQFYKKGGSPKPLPEDLELRKK